MGIVLIILVLKLIKKTQEVAGVQDTSMANPQNFVWCI